MKSCFLLGWHETLNIGDDLMAELYINEAKKNMIIYIHSFKRLYSLNNNIVLPKFRALLKMFSSDDLIIPGGNIFLISSRKSYFKLLIFFTVFYFRRVFNNPVYIDSIGLDLKIGKLNRYILLAILNQANDLSIREPLSYRYLRYCKYKLSLKFNLELDFDRVYRYRYRDVLLKINTVSRSKNNLIWFISGQPAEKDKKEKKNTYKIIQLVQEKYNFSTLNVIFFCQNKNDLERVDKIIKEYTIIENNKVIVYDYFRLEEQMNTISSSKLAIAERYHGAIISESLGIAWYKLAFSEKLKRIYIPNRYCLNCK